MVRAALVVPEERVVLTTLWEARLRKIARHKVPSWEILCHRVQVMLTGLFYLFMEVRVAKASRRYLPITVSRIGVVEEEVVRAVQAEMPARVDMAPAPAMDSRVTVGLELSIPYRGLPRVNLWADLGT